MMNLYETINLCAMKRRNDREVHKLCISIYKLIFCLVVGSLESESDSCCRTADMLHAVLCGTKQSDRLLGYELIASAAECQPVFALCCV